MTGIIEVTLNGEVKQLKFGNYALEKYTKLTGVDIGNIKQLDDNYTQLDMTADIIYCGLFGAYRANKKVVDFTIDDVQSWVDSMGYADQLVVIKEFMSCVVLMTEEMLNAFKAMGEGSETEKKK
jgi:hypothetical protein